MTQAHFGVMQAFAPGGTQIAIITLAGFLTLAGGCAAGGPLRVTRLLTHLAHGSREAILLREKGKYRDSVSCLAYCDDIVLVCPDNSAAV